MTLKKLDENEEGWPSLTERTTKERSTERLKRQPTTDLKTKAGVVMW